MTTAATRDQSPASLITRDEEGRLVIGAEGSLATFLSIVFPHGSHGTAGVPGRMRLEANEVLGLLLAIMVPADGKHAQLSLAFHRCGGLRHFDIKDEVLEGAMWASVEYIIDDLPADADHREWLEVARRKAAELQADPRLQLGVEDIIDTSKTSSTGAARGMMR